MPYIKKDLRYKDRYALTPGELNWQITSLVQDYIRTTGLDYQTLNDVIGALECCKLELYRRVIAPYEDKKIQENGDVYA